MPWAFAGSMPNQVAVLHHFAEMFLQGVTAYASHANHVAHRHPAMVTGMVEDLRGQFGQRRNHQLFTLDLRGEALHLLLQCAQHEFQP